MVAIAKPNRSHRSSTAWQDRFVTMLPAIRQHACISFRHLPPELCEECIQEAVCNACRAMARLAERGKLELAYPGPLAKHAVAQVKAGRKVGGHLNCRDVLSTYCQQVKKLTVQRINHFDQEENAWQEAVVQDKRNAPVPDIVRFRLDFSAWLSQLPRRKRRIAECLALGHQTGEVARKFHVTAGRMAQMRKEFFVLWEAFQGDADSVPA